MFFVNCKINAKLLLYLLVLTSGFMLMSEPAWAAETITVHSNVLITADISDFNAGEKVTTNHDIGWTSDVGWLIEVRSLSADLGDSDDISYTKPLSDFFWRHTVAGTWTAITTSYVTVKLMASGPPSGNFDLDYRFLLDWAADKPGTYTANLEYQITSL